MVVMFDGLTQFFAVIIEELELLALFFGINYLIDHTSLVKTYIRDEVALFALRAVMFFIFAIEFLILLGLPLYGLLTIFSISILSIGLSSRDLLSQLIAGFYVPLHKGDLVRLDSIEYEVVSIGFLYSRLINKRDMKLKYVPNGLFLQLPFDLEEGHELNLISAQFPDNSCAEKPKGKPKKSKSDKTD